MTEVGTSATMPGPRHGMITLNLAMFMSNIAYMPQHECQVWICHQWVLGSGAASNLLFELNEIATGNRLGTAGSQVTLCSEREETRGGLMVSGHFVKGAEP